MEGAGALIHAGPAEPAAAAAAVPVRFLHGSLALPPVSIMVDGKPLRMHASQSASASASAASATAGTSTMPGSFGLGNGLLQFGESSKYTPLAVGSHMLEVSTGASDVTSAHRAGDKVVLRRAFYVAPGSHAAKDPESYRTVAIAGDALNGTLSAFTFNDAGESKGGGATVRMGSLLDTSLAVKPCFEQSSQPFGYLFFPSATNHYVKKAGDPTVLVIEQGLVGEGKVVASGRGNTTLRAGGLYTLWGAGHGGRGAFFYTADGATAEQVV